ncbi:hypothetical protein B1750_gp029 [Noumeavirus]|uniref:hypothetical protein n=1 Tax=Noumeavirus TaxID=1955558 RepID=UPI000982DE1C|nr:hypothetical protein B1750_gp029 [Noumeavirus]AQM73010.1 hypothetical protein NMV_029 [Noumeavirus]
MNRNSSVILPKITNLLEGECFLSQKDYNVLHSVRTFFVKGEVITGLEISVYFFVEHKRASYFMCGWGEQFEEKKGRAFCRKFGLVSEDDAFKIIAREISQSPRIKKHLTSPLFLEKKKNEELKKQNELLLEKIERLRRKKRELKYAPGGQGALQAQQHFENILR